MNPILTLSAIAMFAVVMGLGVVAPAAMANPNNQHTPASVDLCHFDNNSGLWQVITKNEHAAAAHQGHGDLVVPDVISAFDCLAQNNG